MKEHPGRRKVLDIAFCPHDIIAWMEQYGDDTGERLEDTRIDPDLEPLYVLSEREYQGVINGLTNVILDGIQQISAIGLDADARTIALAAHTVLLDYDDDVAEHLLRVTSQPDDNSDERLEVR